MSQRTPQIGEIVVVPLVHPNGVYIRIDGDTKIPILAKVRSKFGDMVNVINFFGYVYNVPISHTEPINSLLQTNYYVDMVNNAQMVMQGLGYASQNNSEFYDTSPGVSYTFFSYLPGYTKSYVHTYSNNNSNNNSNNISNNYHTYDYTYDDTYENTVNVMKINDDSILHIINIVKVSNRKHNDIIFDTNTGLLDIKGYCKFLIDESFTYVKDNNTDNDEYVILRSDRNYIHIKKTNVKYEISNRRRLNRPNISNISNVSTINEYKIKLIKPDIKNKKHIKYFNIFEIIRNELAN